MEPSRRHRLADRITESGFVRDVIGPRVLEPVTAWYEQHLRSEDATAAPMTDHSGVDTTIDVTDTATPNVNRFSANASAETRRVECDPSGATTTPSRSIESAQNAERFLAGEAQDPPARSSAAGRAPRRHSPVPGVSEPDGPSRADPADASPIRATGIATATAPPVGGLAGVRDITLRVKARIKHHNLNVVAAGIAFWSLLAIPALLTATISIYGLVASPDDVERQIEDALSGVSAEAKSVIGDQLANITGGNSGGLAVGAVFGIVLALWSASGAVAKMIATMNTIWEVRENRKFFQLRGVAIAITLGAILFFLSSVCLLAIVPALLGETTLGDLAKTLISIGRFPALLVFMMVGLTFLYWFGPNRDAGFRLLTWGAFIGTAGWLVLSALFSLYTTYFASYNETYAAMGSIVVLLLWMFITAFMVLVGAEIDAALEERDAEVTAAEING